MKVCIYCIGKTKEKYHLDEIAEYTKRLSKYIRINIIELPEHSLGNNPSSSEIEKIKSIESSQLSSKIDGTYSILLDVAGKIISSEDFSKLLEEVTLYQTSDISFIMGGAYGVSDDLKKQVNYRLSISKMTFTHQMIRVILLEQIYRAIKIKEGSKYHK